MNTQLILRKLIKREKVRCEGLYMRLCSIFENLPKGSLIDRNGHMYRAFRENKKQYQKPIREDIQLLQDLRQRRYLKKAIPILVKRIEACRLFLETDRMYDPVEIEASFREIYQGAMDLGMFLEGDISVEEWKQEQYIRNSYPFREKHVTDGGMQVRSKAESMIGTQMEHFHMLFRPEPQIVLEGRIFFADFEVFLPKIRRRIYIEHFGKMDDPEYWAKAMYKIRNYHKAGLYLGVNFFFTWETKDRPLTIGEINEMLNEIRAMDQI